MTSSQTMAKPAGVATRNQAAQAFISFTHIGTQCPTSTKEEMRYAATFSSAACQTEAEFSVESNTHHSFQPHACCEKCKLFVCQCAGDRHSPTEHAEEEPKGEKHCDSYLQYSSNIRKSVEEHVGTQAEEKPGRANLVAYESEHSIQECFLQPTDLSLHQEMHTIKDCYTCQYCPELFHQESDLIAHTKAHSGKACGCAVAHESLPPPTDTGDNKKCHSAEEVSVQGVSQMSCFEPRVSANHNTVYTSAYPYARGFCPARFARNISLAAHKKRHASSIYQVVWQKSLFQESGLALHKKVHTRKKTNVYLRELLAKKTFDARETVCSQEKPSGSTDCSTKHTLLDHQTTCTQAVNRHACLECGKEFPDRAQLATHLATHRAPRPYACSICGQRFACSNSVMEHEGSVHYRA